MTISVVIPAYNSRDTIVEALESVRKQKFGKQKAEIGEISHRDPEAIEKDRIGKVEIEVIVVDDCSKDDTADVVQEYIPHSTFHIQLLSMQRNSGPAAARNAGIKAAKGHWIAFLDADDTWLPDKLDMQVRYLGEHPDVVMICGNTEEKIERKDFEQKITKMSKTKTTNPENNVPQDSSSSFSSLPFVEKSLPLTAFAVSNPVATSTVLVRRDALEAVGGFDEQFCGPEDYDLWMRIAAQVEEAGGEIVKLGAPLAEYRSEQGSLSMDDRKFLPQVIKVLEKAYSEGGALSGFSDKKRAALANQYWNASWMAFHRRCRRRALFLLLKGFLLHPPPFERCLKWFGLGLRYLCGPKPPMSCENIPD